MCQCIDHILTGQFCLLPEYSGQLEATAQRLAAQLLAKQRVDTTAPQSQQSPEQPQEKEPDIQPVDLDSLEWIRLRSVGVEQVGLWAMDPLSLRTLLQALGLGLSLTTVVIGSIIGRMARSGSERATRDWLSERSALGKLLGTDFAPMGSMRLTYAADALIAHQETIERHLFDRAADLFEPLPTDTLYDLTQTEFEGGASRQPTARPGHARERCDDCPLLTLAWGLDASGCVRHSRVFAGHVCAHRTLPVRLKALDTLPVALGVMGRGITTEERIQWLREQGVRYLVVSRGRTRRFDAEATARVETASGPDARLPCRSERRAAKERGIAERLATQFEQGMNQLAEGLAKSRAHKRVDPLWQRIVGRV